MPQVCKLCSLPNSQRVDAALVAGAHVATVAAEVSRSGSSVSESAVRRHVRNHLQGNVLRAMREQNSFQSGDLLERLMESLDDLSAVRSSALMSGSTSTVVRAATASEQIIRTLLDRLGIDDASMLAEIRTAESLGRAVGRAARKHPEVARAVGVELRAMGLHDDADALDRIATVVSENNERTTS